MGRKTIRCHQAFYAGMQIKLSEDATQLEFVQELILGNEPVSSIVIAPVAFS